MISKRRFLSKHTGTFFLDVEKIISKGLSLIVGVWGQEHWKSHVFQVFLNHIELDAHVFSYIL